MANDERCARCGHGRLHHNEEADHCSLCHRSRITPSGTAACDAETCLHPYVPPVERCSVKINVSDCLGPEPCDLQLPCPKHPPAPSPDTQRDVIHTVWLPLIVAIKNAAWLDGRADALVNSEDTQVAIDALLARLTAQPPAASEEEDTDPGCYICGTSLMGKDGDWCAEFHGPFIAIEIANLKAKLNQAEAAQRYLYARKRGGR